MTELHENNQRVKNLISVIRILREEVRILESRVRPASTGHIITAIGVINGRIDEIVGELVNEQPDKGRELASRIYDEDERYKEHTEAMEQARLKRIQDYNSGEASFKKSTMWSANKEGHWAPDENINEKHIPERPNAVRDAYLHSSKVNKDDVEHTEEYYDTQRNLPFNTFK